MNLQDYFLDVWNNGHGYYGNCEYYVGCNNNKCVVRPKTRSLNDVYDNKEEVIQKSIKRWNSR